MSTGVEHCEEHRAEGEQAHQRRSFSGMAVSMTARRMSGGTALITAAQHHGDDEADQLAAVRPGEPQDATHQVAFDLLALDRTGVAAESVSCGSHHRRIVSAVNLPVTARADRRNGASLVSGG